MHYFCQSRNELPLIKIEFYLNNIIKSTTTISQSDIPIFEKSSVIKIKYSKKSGQSISKINKTEDFTIESFKMKTDFLKENKISLVSKGEVIEESDVSLQNIAANDCVDGSRFLFLLSGNYIDQKDTNLRGILNILTIETFKKGDLFHDQEEILIEDIQSEVNNAINVIYPEFEKIKLKHENDFDNLKEMFLLDADIANNVNISLNDTPNKILEKFYELEAKRTASFDASLKESVDNIEKLDTTRPEYQNALRTAVDELVKKIPHQNKKSLTHYVARRKLVLDLFQKLIDNEAVKFKNGGRIDEDVLHNLIFQQSTSDPISSDLWLINEEYIYFKGVSEGNLGQIELDGSKIFKQNLSFEEKEYRTKQGGDANLKRTDILLFPAEAKCIIIELKAPDVNISDHLNQINKYAALINNLSLDSFKFNTFYGYLIGENINSDDVIDNDSDFINASNLGYIFRSYKRIIGKFGRADGSLYTEIIKYSTLLARSKLRNQIFIDKLCNS